jgi:hypothetical protein
MFDLLLASMGIIGGYKAGAVPAARSAAQLPVFALQDVSPFAASTFAFLTFQATVGKQEFIPAVLQTALHVAVSENPLAQYIWQERAQEIQMQVTNDMGGIFMKFLVCAATRAVTETAASFFTDITSRKYTFGEACKRALQSLLVLSVLYSSTIAKEVVAGSFCTPSNILSCTAESVFQNVLQSQMKDAILIISSGLFSAIVAHYAQSIASLLPEWKGCCVLSRR